MNGKEGRAMDVSFDPLAEVMHINNNIYIVSKPPLCVYVKIEDC